jgi:hypothetical protein
MRVRRVVLVVSTGVYWLFALGVAALAELAPCGLAPGEWCELEGPTRIGAVLGNLGPVGVFVVALVIYATSIWLLVRRWKAP